MSLNIYDIIQILHNLNVYYGQVVFYCKIVKRKKTFAYYLPRNAHSYLQNSLLYKIENSTCYVSGF